jgi:hypothetical protein
MMAKRHLLPLSGPQEPVSSAIATFVASVTVEAVVTGAIIGAVGAAVTGGDILKGALLGGLGGALTSGIGGVMAGEAGAASGAIGAENLVANAAPVTEAAKVAGLNDLGLSQTASNLGNSVTGVNLAPTAPASFGPNPAMQGSQAFTTGSQAAANTGLNTAASSAGVGTRVAANTGITQKAVEVGSEVAKKTGLLNSAGDMVSKALSSPYGAAAAMQLGGAMLTGKSADKRAEEQAAAYEAARARRMMPIKTQAEQWG